ncbi:MAG: Hpt domain-containing protein [Lachnospiraceae bacterium]|nr:Hpt domain-containing protein [Lachnospiraceae bacterium]
MTAGDHGFTERSIGMLTLDKLKEYGADTEDALARCMGKEDFYLMLVGKAVEDSNFKSLRDAIETKDYDGAFSAAHALKGIVSNLSLTPLSKPVIEITELLRSRTDTDYTELLADIDEQKSRLEELMSG